jgi:signal peptidase II
MRGVHRLGLAAGALAIILDQLSKPLMRDWLGGGDLYVAPFFNLVSAWNKGVGFSLMTMQGASGPYILSGLALVISAGLLVWLLRSRRALPVIGLGLAIGGALGNVIDRLAYGAVFDFLQFHLGDYYWPAFNLADSALTIGVALLLIDGLFEGRGRSKNPAPRDGQSSDGLPG